VLRRIATYANGDERHTSGKTNGVRHSSDQLGSPFDSLTADVKLTSTVQPTAPTALLACDDADSYVFT